MAPFESLGTVTYSHSTVTMALPFTISDMKRDIYRKSRFFIIPAFDAPLEALTGILPCRLVWKN